MSSSEMDSKTLLICWINPEQAEFVCATSQTTHLPEYFRRELESLRGRPGRARLWVPAGFPDIDLTELFASATTPLLVHLIAHLNACGGIVFLPGDIALVDQLGIITDQQLNIVVR